MDNLTINGLFDDNYTFEHDLQELEDDPTLEIYQDRYYIFDDGKPYTGNNK